MPPSVQRGNEGEERLWSPGLGRSKLLMDFLPPVLSTSSISVLVVAHKTRCCTQNARVNNKQTLTSLTPEAFAANAQAVVDIILEKDKNLTEETSRHWSEISSRSYLFDRNIQEAATVASLTPEDLLKFYDVNFSKRGARRRKVSTWVYGNQHSMEGDDAKEGEESSGLDGTLPSGTGLSGAGLKASRDGDAMVCQRVDAKICGTGFENGTDEMQLRQVIVIEDCVEFKRSMPLLPLRKTARMSAVVETSKL